ncbi:MAG TPA: biotin-dependent carboxyltransferase family protein [Anaerolineaceae bacterium]|nr:biotin-dependent carboxyltransferase family protein [Anaerolineaceae bacterium]HPN49958.1 biotin-dependent carboxyltransferase family protein [Anaerolineaceae bacterium]
MCPIEVLDPGFFTSIQDLGRRSWQQCGVPISGAMDPLALASANTLVGNPAGAAGLEWTLGGLALRAHEDTLVAAAGRGFRLEINGWEIPLWMSAVVRRGWTVRVYHTGSGWGYLAFSGGLAVPEVMGSRSTYIKGGFGGLDGRFLQAGDLVDLNPASPSPELAARSLPVNRRPSYSDDLTIGVIPGPKADAFTSETLAAFYQSTYTISQVSDRMGFCLDGPPLQHISGADILSEGTLPGCIQVPGNGQPIVLMRDCQTTGGYTKIATVIQADLPLLAQLPPGSGQVRFKPVTLETAHALHALRWQNATQI